MATYRQLPEVSAGCTRASRRRGSRSSSSPASRRSRSSSPARRTSSGRCTRSARCSRSRSRTRRDRAAGARRGRGARLQRAAEPPLPRGRLAALRDPRRARDGARLARRRRPGGRHALGRARLARVGFAAYAVYRRRVVHTSLRETVRAPEIVLGALEIEYRTIVVPVVRSAETEEALVAAARLAVRARGRRSSSCTCSRCRSPCRSTPTCRPRRRRRRAPRRGARARRDATGLRDRQPPRARPQRRGRRSCEEAVRRDAELIVVGARRRCAAARRCSAGRSTTSCRTPGARAVTPGGGRRDRAARRPRRPAGRARGRDRRRTIALGVGGGIGLLLGVLLIARRRRCGSTFSADGSRWRGSARPRARPRRPLAGGGRLRRDRLVALLRARHRRARARSASRRGSCSASARSSCSSRSPTRRAWPRSRRRAARDLRPPRVQRPARVLHRLGAPPRLPDRDRARGALRAALRGARARLGRA